MIVHHLYLLREGPLWVLMLQQRTLSQNHYKQALRRDEDDVSALWVQKMHEHVEH